MTFRLHIADPGLKVLTGHHAGAMHALASAGGGERPVFHGHAEPSGELVAEARRLGVGLKPFFAVSYYTAFDSRDSLEQANGYVNALAREYLRLFEEIAKDAGPGMVLHHTLDWPHLQALGVALALAGESRDGSHAGSLDHLVFLMFNPGIDHRGTLTDARRFLSYRMAAGLLQGRRNVRLFAACREHAIAFSSVLAGGAELAVHPCFFFQAEDAAGGSSCSSDLRQLVGDGTVILHLGHARQEKGFCELPRLIRALMPHLGDRSELLIHFDPNSALAPPGPRLAATIEELRALAVTERRIKLLEGFLPDRALAELIAASRLAFFNYDPQVYAARTSGLLWQVCCSRLPVAIIGESWLSREAKRLSGAVFAFAELREFEDALAGGKAVLPGADESDARYRAGLFGSLDGFLERQRSLRTEAGTDEPGASAARGPSSRVRNVLVVDSDIPDAASSGGGYAATQELRLLRSLGCRIAFSTPAGITPDERALRLEDQGIEMLYRPRYGGANQVLAERGHEFELVYVTRYAAAKAVLDALRCFAPQASIVLNVCDLHFLREMRRAALPEYAWAMEDAEAIRADELGVLAAADLVLTYSDYEKSVIEAQLAGSVPVALCPWVEDVRAAAPSYESRRDIAFLGGYVHGPNADAVIWFVGEVMPRLRRRLPGVRLRVYGANVPRELKELACDDVIIDGFVHDVSTVYDSCRVFVAPMRYGAGLKGKVAGALARGVPCVLSPVAVEGFFCAGNAAAAVAASPEEWVAAVAALYTDPAAWAAASRASLEYAGRHFRFADGVRRMADALRLAKRRPQPGH